MADGALVLVVGPSGAGKDTLIAGARARLGEDRRFVFPRRVVTRTAMAELEDHDSVTPEEFESSRRQGAYALDWQAHGLSYGIPIRVIDDMAQGRMVVANTSRRVLHHARLRFARCHVLLVTARPDIRAGRLAGRGRETTEEVAARLLHEGAPIPDGLEAVVIDNSGSLDAGVAAFTTALVTLAR